MSVGDLLSECLQISQLRLHELLPLIETDVDSIDVCLNQWIHVRDDTTGAIQLVDELLEPFQIWDLQSAKFILTGHTVIEKLVGFLGR
jgi:hypothetical protein